MAVKKKNAQVMAVYRGDIPIERIYLGETMIFPFNVHEAFHEFIALATLSMSDETDMSFLTPFAVNCNGGTVNMQLMQLSDSVSGKIFRTDTSIAEEF